MDDHGMRLLVVGIYVKLSTAVPSGESKNAILRRSITSIDVSSINFFTLDGTAEPIEPAPEQTWILVAVSGSK